LIAHFGLDDVISAIAGPSFQNHSADKSAQVLAVIPEGIPHERVCMVGDRCFDVLAAKKIGLTAVGVTYGYGTEEELRESGADVVVHSVSELGVYLSGNAEKPYGRFITFEGTDGCGKSTQIQKLDDYLRHRGYETVLSREPGGCPISERIREVILDVENTGMTAECEALLYAASRIQHVHDVILPALKEGKIVLCDRFFDSSVAYQAYGRQLGEPFIRQINEKALEEVQPDCTLQLDIDPKTARARVSQARTPDRLEREKEEFFLRVRGGYEAVAQKAGERIHRIDSGRSVDEVFADIVRAVGL
jgi:thymidylate kinase